MTVRELRRRWKPHKERLSAEEAASPTAIRFHRACSWLAQTEALQADTDTDLVLIQQWIALNALYGRWDTATGEPIGDRKAWKCFLERIVALDRAGHVAEVLMQQRQLALAIFENSYINRHFWDEPSPEAQKRFSNTARKAQSWFIEKRWLWIAEQLLERIYFLRCQIMHGAATQGGKLNREALQQCTTMLRLLLPAILLVWIDHGVDEDWGPLCYPPLADAAS